MAGTGFRFSKKLSERLAGAGQQPARPGFFRIGRQELPGGWNKSYNFTGRRGAGGKYWDLPQTKPF